MIAVPIHCHNMVTKYYAFVCGVVPGIYTDWPTTERMVKGYPGQFSRVFVLE